MEQAKQVNNFTPGMRGWVSALNEDRSIKVSARGVISKTGKSSTQRGFRGSRVSTYTGKRRNPMNVKMVVNTINDKGNIEEKSIPLSEIISSYMPIKFKNHDDTFYILKAYFNSLVSKNIIKKSTSKCGDDS